MQIGWNGQVTFALNPKLQVNVEEHQSSGEDHSGEESEGEEFSSEEQE